LDKEEDFQRALAQENMTMDDLRKQLERQMLIEQVQRQEVGSKLTITEEEARQNYGAHPGELTERTACANVAADDEAQKKIADVRARALRAEDFAKLAAEVSASSSKANGGLIGPFSRGDMSPALEGMVRKME